MQELDDFINRAKHLPPAPRILPQLMMLLGKPDIDADQVTRLITYDPALTASVLQLCNSAYIGAASPADNLQEAITRLGFRQIYQLVAAISGARALSPAQKGYGIESGELWKHSVAAAVAAQLMARDLGDDEQVAFTAALLHDIGKIVLAEALEPLNGRLMAAIEKQHCAAVEAEKMLLGVQHDEIGGRLLARWKFPPRLVAAVWFHHQPASAKPYERLASYVYLGNLVAYFLGYGYGHQAFALQARAEALEILGLSSAELSRYAVRTLENVETVQALCQIHV